MLRKLRETEVSSVSESTYSKLIGEFINESKEEVEDSWDWSHLREDIDITTQVGVSKYTATGLGDRFDILQVLNIPRDSIVRRTSYSWMKRQLLLGNSSQSSPIYYNVHGTDGTDPLVDMFPVPNSVETITFNVVRRQDDLVSDTTELLIPNSAVVLGAYYRAVKERGEDQGDGSGQAAADYAKVWNSAIARDVALQEEETEWQVR